jgi:hypothetical protein
MKPSISIILSKALNWLLVFDLSNQSNETNFFLSIQEVIDVLKHLPLQSAKKFCINSRLSVCQLLVCQVLGKKLEQS